MTLKNRVVVMTGATGGLGRVVARDLIDHGARLALLGRSTERLQQLVKELNLMEDDYLIRTVNLNSPESVGRAAEVVADKFGKTDVLLNLVGGWSGGQAVIEVDPIEVTNMIQQHLWTTFNLSQAYLPQLLENGWGRILIVSSPFAAAPRAKGAAYAIGKAAQEALMLALAEEVKGTGVTSNVLLVKTIDASHARENTPSSKNSFWTTPEEISGTILYLCSNEAKTINGARIPLYGSP